MRAARHSRTTARGLDEESECVSTSEDRAGSLRGAPRARRGRGQRAILRPERRDGDTRLPASGRSQEGGTERDHAASKLSALDAVPSAEGVEARDASRMCGVGAVAVGAGCARGVECLAGQPVARCECNSARPRRPRAGHVPTDRRARAARRRAPARTRSPRCAREPRSARAGGVAEPTRLMRRGGRRWQGARGGGDQRSSNPFNWSRLTVPASGGKCIP